MTKGYWTAALLIGMAGPAVAEVSIGEHGFTTSNSATVSASPDAVWAALIDPAQYWNGEHSWGGDAAAFSLDPRAGGCFCETLPDEGSVEHMRVTMVQPGRTLRLSGALGPLQSEGLAGSLTWQLEPVDGGTRIVQSYAVGGHMAFPVEAIAPAVDGVVREQLERLAALFGD